MYIRLKLRPDAGWLNPDNAGKVFEGLLIKREPSHLPGIDWITIEHPTETYTNLWGETHKMLYGFRSDIVEILDEGDVGNTSSNCP